MIYSLIIFSFLIKTLHKKVPFLWLSGFSFIICFLPIFLGFSINYYLTGLFSQLSILSVIFYLYWLFDWRIALNQKKLVHFKLALILFGLILFGLHIFSNHYSLYQFGFGHLYTMVFVFALLCLSIFFKYWFVFSCLTLALLCFVLQNLESQNLFDYLIDPFLLFILPFTFWGRQNEV